MIVLAFILVIALHEVGHVFFGQILGFRLRSVTILIPLKKSILKIRFRNVDYILGWLPLGGYTQFWDKSNEVWKWVLMFSGGCIFNFIYGFSILSPENMKNYITAMIGLNVYDFTFLQQSAFISIILGVINLIPSPLTDGGQIVKILK